MLNKKSYYFDCLEVSACAVCCIKPNLPFVMTTFASNFNRQSEKWWQECVCVCFCACLRIKSIWNNINTVSIYLDFFSLFSTPKPFLCPHFPFSHFVSPVVFVFSHSLFLIFPLSILHSFHSTFFRSCLSRRNRSGTEDQIYPRATDPFIVSFWVYLCCFFAHFSLSHFQYICIFSVCNAKR